MAKIKKVNSLNVTDEPSIAPNVHLHASWKGSKHLSSVLLTVHSSFLVPPLKVTTTQFIRSELQDTILESGHGK